MSGAEEQFREFVRSRAAPLHRAAYLLCGDWHLADDLVQEALAKTFRHWRRVQMADSPDAYVRRILINEVNRHFQRHRHVPAPIDTAGRQHEPADPAHPDASGGLARRDLLLTANSETALQAGAGNTRVRAGVLRSVRRRERKPGGRLPPHWRWRTPAPPARIPYRAGAGGPHPGGRPGWPLPRRR